MGQQPDLIPSHDGLSGSPVAYTASYLVLAAVSAAPAMTKKTLSTRSDGRNEIHCTVSASVTETPYVRACVTIALIYLHE
jgi:hypothetical protein